MTIADKAMLVTGARGLGQTLVEEALEQRRKAGGRRYAPALGRPGWRVTLLTLDVTSAAQT
jgi:hypothetical protein